MDMQFVTTLGGPQVLLPTRDIDRWCAELGDEPSPDSGLYGLACSVKAYCGVIAPWNTPLLVFGDEPADIYCRSGEFDGLLFRWLAADSLAQLVVAATQQAKSEVWDETISFEVVASDMTLMDTCTFAGDEAPRIHMQIPPGAYSIRSRYVDGPDAMTIVHRFDRVDAERASAPP